LVGRIVRKKIEIREFLAEQKYNGPPPPTTDWLILKVRREKEKESK
jgi:hypothetical protein